MRLFALALFLGSTLLAGCATGPAYNSTGQTMTAVPSGQGRIVFFRPSVLGAAVQPEITLDGQTVGVSKAKGFFYVDVLPGPHLAAVKTEVTRESTINVVAGQTQYVRTTMSMGVLVGRLSFEAVDAITGLREVGELSYTGTAPLVHASAAGPMPAPAAAPSAIQAAANTNASQAASAAAPTAAAGTIDLRAPLKRGDELAYRLTDRMTRVSREVVYRVDRIEGDRVVFNQGSRVETLDGAVITLDAPVGGDLERMAPPQGWTKPNMVLGERWPLRYSLKDGGRAVGDYRLTAEVKSKTRLTTPVGELDVFYVEYTGWVRRTDTAHTGVSYKLVARAWYAPELRRIVRFESDNTPGTTGGFLAPSREMIELIAIRRL